VVTLNFDWINVFIKTLTLRIVYYIIASFSVSS
jgi:hypothetical protein